MDALYNQFKKFGKIKTNVQLARYTTFRIGGTGRFLITITQEDNLIQILNFLSEEGLEYIILGGGSNILFSDRDFDGIVIHIALNKITVQQEQITVAAGTALAKVVDTAGQKQFSGLEWAIGIPGTIGGAIRGNAGAMGAEIAHSVQTVRIWQDGKTEEITQKKCGFAYRHSIFKTNKTVIMSATIQLQSGDKLMIAKTTQEYLSHRTGRYPRDPSAGSFFKNIDLKNWSKDISDLPPLFIARKKIPVGWLIEQCGLKGYTVGGAKISDQHGNFIINFNQATQTDILKIVEEATQRVYNKFNITLEPEVEIMA